MVISILFLLLGHAAQKSSLEKISNYEDNYTVGLKTDGIENGSGPGSQKSDQNVAVTFNIPISSMQTLCSCPKLDRIQIPQYLYQKLRKECGQKIEESEQRLKSSLFHEASVRLELEQRFFQLEKTTKFLENFYKETGRPNYDLIQHILNRLHVEKSAREGLENQVNMLQQQLKVVKAMTIDCEHIRRPGVYDIHPANYENSIPVYCDNGWTIIQKRFNGVVDFYRDWKSYADGFGDLEGEYWLGNNNIYRITNQAKYRLRIEMTDWHGKNFYAEYDEFQLGGPDQNYRLHVNGHHGDIRDGLTRKDSRHNHNNMPFSTFDQNNQPNKTSYCAEIYHGAWWYNSCYASNLNGRYCKPITVSEQAQCMVWWGDNEDDRVIMKSVTMKIKETSDDIIVLKAVDN